MPTPITQMLIPEPALRQLLTESGSGAAARLLGVNRDNIESWRKRLGTPDPWKGWNLLMLKAGGRVIQKRWQNWQEAIPEPIPETVLLAAIDREAGVKSAVKATAPPAPLKLRPMPTTETVLAVIKAHSNERDAWPTADDLSEIGGWLLTDLQTVLWQMRTKSKIHLTADERYSIRQRSKMLTWHLHPLWMARKYGPPCDPETAARRRRKAGIIKVRVRSDMLLDAEVIEDGLAPDLVSGRFTLQGDMAVIKGVAM